MAIRRIDNTIHVDEVPVPDVVARVGTPCYVYSWQTIRENYERLEHALVEIDHHIHYAVKANSNLSILKRLSQMGAGFDIVSGGELERVLKISCDPAKVVFSGVGKSIEELSFALKCGIGCINVESESEFHRIHDLCRSLNLNANIAFRLNPEIDPETHPYISTALATSKFGLNQTEIKNLVSLVNEADQINLVGLSCHIGSQISKIDPFQDALNQLLTFYDELSEDLHSLRFLNIGGGFSIRYQHENAFEFEELISLRLDELKDRNLKLYVEPGRSLVGDAGLLVTKVEYLKTSESAERPNFAVVDAAMNDLLRPSLYNAWHEIDNVVSADGDKRTWNIVGPVCESGDFLGLERNLYLQEEELLAIHGAGAYGHVLSSNYNSRLRIPEVLIDEKQILVIRERESMHDLLKLEPVV